MPPPSRIVRQGHLDEFQLFPFLGINNINVPVERVAYGMGGSLLGEKIAIMLLINWFNDRVDNSILDAEVNACGIIAIPIIENILYNDHIHVLNDPTKQYIY